MTAGRLQAESRKKSRHRRIGTVNVHHFECFTGNKRHKMRQQGTPRTATTMRRIHRYLRHIARRSLQSPVSYRLGILAKNVKSQVSGSTSHRIERILPRRTTVEPYAKSLGIVRRIQLDQLPGISRFQRYITLIAIIIIKFPHLLETCFAIHTHRRSIMLQNLKKILLNSRFTQIRQTVIENLSRQALAPPLRNRTCTGIISGKTPVIMMSDTIKSKSHKPVIGIESPKRQLPAKSTTQKHPFQIDSRKRKFIRSKSGTERRIKFFIIQKCKRINAYVCLHNQINKNRVITHLLCHTKIHTYPHIDKHNAPSSK